MENKQIIYYLNILKKMINASDMEDLMELVTSLDYYDEDKINEILEYLEKNENN